MIIVTLKSKINKHLCTLHRVCLQYVLCTCYAYQHKLVLYTCLQFVLCICLSTGFTLSFQEVKKKISEIFSLIFFVNNDLGPFLPAL